MTQLSGFSTPILFLKATQKKLIYIPPYTKSDGTVVPGHQAYVHVADDHDDHKVKTGQGTYTQKQAHAKHAHEPWFQALPEEHQAPVLMHIATGLQDAASSAAVVSTFKKKIVAGIKPTPGEWKAYASAPEAKKAEVKAAAEAAGHGALLAQDPAAVAPAAAAPVAAPAADVHSSSHQATPADAGEAAAAAEKPASTASSDYPVGTVFKFDSQYAKMNDGQWKVYNHMGDKVMLHKVGATVPNNDNTVSIPAATLATSIAKGTAKMQPKLSAAEKLAKKVGDGIAAAQKEKLFAKVNGPKPAAVAETGPKEGDTKPGADGGTLVLKDGHWIKQGGDDWLAGLKEYNPAIDAVLAKIEGQKLPASNSNAAGFNPKLSAIAAHVKAGDVHALLHMGFGSNTYQAKAVKLVNEALAALGVSHKVDVSQKMGKHAAIVSGEVKPGAVGAPAASAAPAAAPAPAEPPKAVAAAVKPPAVDEDEFVGQPVLAGKPAYDHVAQGNKETAAGGVKAAHDWLAANPDGKAELKEALSDHGLYHVALQMGLGDPAPAAAPAGKKLTAAELPPMPGFPTSLQNSWAMQAKAAALNGDVDAVKALLEKGSGDKYKGYVGSLLAAMNGTAAAPAAPKADPFAGVPQGIHKTADVLPQLLAAGYTVDKVKGQFHHLKAPDGTIALVAKDIAEVYLQDLLKKAKASPKPAAAPAPAAPSASAATTPVTVFGEKYLNQEDGHNKFWSVGLHGNQLITHYGKIGTKGAKTVKTYASKKEALAEMTKIVGQKEKKGYYYDGSTSIDHDAPADGAAPAAAPAAQPAGPKEGDTKMGADGMLVLKNGHWVKVGQDAPQPPDLGTISNLKKKHMALVQHALHDGDVVALEKLTSDAQENAAEDGPSNGKWAKIAEYSQQVLDYVNGSKNGGAGTTLADLQAMDPPKKRSPKVTGAKAKPTPANAVSDGPVSMDGWTKTGGQKGYNDGGFFTDPSGQQWYAKFPAGGEGVVKNELVANKLAGLAGINVPALQMVNHGGKVGLASKIIPGAKEDKAALLAGKAHGILDSFAVHAWLANWDAVGNNPSKGFDNILVDDKGVAHHIDQGGALNYGGAGGKKGKFSEKVIELKSMLDAGTNANTAAVFAKMSQADIAASVAKVASVPDDAIIDYCLKYGPGSLADRQKLGALMVARKADMLAQYPAAAKAIKAAKGKKEKKAIVFDPSKLGTAPDFLNWKGPGLHGPATAEYKNKANQEGVNKLLEVAKQGDIAAVKAVKFPLYDAQGNVSGFATALDHPSQYVTGFAQQLVNEIDAQLNPVEAFRFKGDSQISAINDAFPVKSVATASKKLGYYVIAGKSDTFPTAEVAAMGKLTFKSGKITTNTFVAQSNAALKKIPKLQRDALQAYTGGGYHEQNNSLWKGNPSGAAKSAAAALHTHAYELPAGLIVSRKIDLSGAVLAQMVGQDVISGNPGTIGKGGACGLILQEPAIMSTAIDPNVWSGNVHLKMTVGPGVKGIYVGTGTDKHGSHANGFSLNASEKEIVFPPNTRMLVQRVLRSNGKDGDGFGTHYTVEVLLLPTQE